MSLKTIPLVGNFTNRPGITYVSSDKDQKLKGCYIDVVTNAISGEQNVYLCKRPGVANVEEIVAAKSGRRLYVGSTLADDLVALFSDGSVYYKSVSWINSNATGNSVFVFNTFKNFITDGVINGVNNFFISSEGSNGCFYLPADAAADGTPTFTADTSSGSPVLTNVSSITNLYVGQALSGTGIAASARILSIDSATQITMTDNATATNATVTITFTQLAKIIDTDFPGNASDTTGPFAYMDGFLFIMSSDGKLWNSEVNNPSSWLASNYTVGTRVGSGVGVVRRKNTIVAFYTSYHETFYNNGNPYASPLRVDKSRTSDIGALNGNIVSHADRIFFIGSTGGDDDAQIWMISDEGEKKISTPQIDRILEQNGSSAVLLQAGNMAGYDFLFVQTSNANYSFMYCIQTDRWFETNFSKCFFFSGSTRAGRGLYALSFTGSNLLRMQSSTFQDESVNFSVVAQTEPYALNGGMSFEIDGVNLLADNQSSGSTLLESSADDYATFGTIGSFPMTSIQKDLPGGGYYDASCAFRLTYTANTAWRAQALQLRVR